MSIVIEADMVSFAGKLGISSSRMARDYSSSTVEEIIEKETERGNAQALSYSREYYHSVPKLINLFRLQDVQNRYVLLHGMDLVTREKILPFLTEEELVMGLNFFKKEKLFKILMKVDIKELVNVAKEAFPLEAIVSLYTEDDMAAFFMNPKVSKEMVQAQMRQMPFDIMQKFIESVTGRPAGETDPDQLITQLGELPDEQFKKFTAFMDPDVQRQLTYQIIKENPDYMELFSQESYVLMLSTLDKPDLVKSMIGLSKDSLVLYNSMLPPNLMSVVGSQMDAEKFAVFLQKKAMSVIENAHML